MRVLFYLSGIICLAFLLTPAVFGTVNDGATNILFFSGAGVNGFLCIFIGLGLLIEDDS